jgi:hypothetical protein
MAIPAQSLQTVIDKRAAHPTEPVQTESTPDLSAFAMCPSCKGPMDRQLQQSDSGKAVIDTCDHCRLNWLEYSQLDRIAQCAHPSAILS